MVYAHGYDHDFAAEKRPGNSMMFATCAYDPRTDRVIHSTMIFRFATDAPLPPLLR
jgi:hypothetical protein